MDEPERGEDRTRPHTVAAVFEDSIDGGLALGAIRKAGREPGDVSIVVAIGDEAVAAAGVARAVAEADLDDLGGWLQGLATVVVPERGSYLVAGPLGAVVAGIGSPDGAPGVRSFQSVLAGFGFSEDEAGYLDKRLAAGAPLVAVSTRTGDSPASVRRLLAAQDAVFIATVETTESRLDTAQELLDAPPEAAVGGGVEVSDAVGNLRHVKTDGGPAPISALLGQTVVDREGLEVGEIDDALVEVYDPDGRSGPMPEVQVVRYVVVGHGGIFGVRRRRVAVPVGLADLQAIPVALTVRRDLLQSAPQLTDEPFSRHDEQAISEHFGIRAYWLDQATA
ncbi:MAG: hypothetical protein AVDCRST_MAG59-2758 [uncultured Thermomicrobiales bacterium]|uniref:PRC-barrel domain-containing protein n=1 Tax=uncultured Thermomicrobiales bacterium TaxID=1645740 RepID=A0A6J4UXW6_9BACT|nr:MAG: hypothetical protein AVDCRST_MAG59-2758 [uncultured Thermomicrobiales bacterium]